MGKPIAAIVGAMLAVLLLAASVAAADPFGWRGGGQVTYGGAGSGSSGYGIGYGCCTNWNQSPTATQAAPTASSNAPGTPTRDQVMTRWSGTHNHMSQRQPTSSGHDRGSGWCDGWGYGDRGSWH